MNDPKQSALDTLLSVYRRMVLNGGTDLAIRLSPTYLRADEVHVRLDVMIGEASLAYVEAPTAEEAASKLLAKLRDNGANV